MSKGIATGADRALGVTTLPDLPRGINIESNPNSSGDTADSLERVYLSEIGEFVDAQEIPTSELDERVEIGEFRDVDEIDYDRHEQTINIGKYLPIDDALDDS